MWNTIQACNSRFQRKDLQFQGSGVLLHYKFIKSEFNIQYWLWHFKILKSQDYSTIFCQIKTTKITKYFKRKWTFKYTTKIYSTAYRDSNNKRNTRINQILQITQELINIFNNYPTWRIIKKKKYNCGVKAP